MRTPYPTRRGRSRTGQVFQDLGDDAVGNFVGQEVAGAIDDVDRHVAGAVLPAVQQGGTADRVASTNDKTSRDRQTVPPVTREVTDLSQQERPVHLHGCVRPGRLLQHLAVVEPVSLVHPIWPGGSRPDAGGNEARRRTQERLGDDRSAQRDLTGAAPSLQRLGERRLLKRVHDAEHDESAKPLGSTKRGEEPGPSSPVVPGDADRFETKGVKRRQQVRGELLLVVAGRRRSAPAVPRRSGMIKRKWSARTGTTCRQQNQC